MLAKRPVAGLAGYIGILLSAGVKVHLTGEKAARFLSDRYVIFAVQNGFNKTKGLEVWMLCKIGTRLSKFSRGSPMIYLSC